MSRQLQRGLAPRTDRIDRDDRRRPAMRAPCTAEEPDRPAADDGNVDAGSTAVTRGTQSRRAGDARAAADHADLGSRLRREDRHDPLLERHHDLGQTADVRVLVDGRAVASRRWRRDRRRRWRSRTGTCPSGRAGSDSRRRSAACRTRRRGRRPARAGPRVRRLDDADAAVTLDDGHVVHAPRAGGARERRRRCRGVGCGGGAKPRTAGRACSRGSWPRCARRPGGR